MICTVVKAEIDFMADFSCGLNTSQRGTSMPYQPWEESIPLLQPTMRHLAVSRYHWLSGCMSADFNVEPIQSQCGFSKKATLPESKPRTASSSSSRGPTMSGVTTPISYKGTSSWMHSASRFWRWSRSTRLARTITTCALRAKTLSVGTFASCETAAIAGRCPNEQG